MNARIRKKQVKMARRLMLADARLALDRICAQWETCTRADCVAELRQAADECVAGIGRTIVHLPIGLDPRGARRTLQQALRRAEEQAVRDALGVRGLR